MMFAGQTTCQWQKVLDLMSKRINLWLGVKGIRPPLLVAAISGLITWEKMVTGQLMSQERTQRQIYESVDMYLWQFLVKYFGKKRWHCLERLIQQRISEHQTSIPTVVFLDSKIKTASRRILRTVISNEYISMLFTERAFLLSSQDLKLFGKQ